MSKELFGLILAIIVGLIVTIGLGTLGGMLFLGAGWSAIHSGGKRSADVMFAAIFFGTIIVPPVMGFLSGRWIYRMFRPVDEQKSH